MLWGFPAGGTRNGAMGTPGVDVVNISSSLQRSAHDWFHRPSFRTDLAVAGVDIDLNGGMMKQPHAGSLLRGFPAVTLMQCGHIRRAVKGVGLCGKRAADHWGLILLGANRLASVASCETSAIGGALGADLNGTDAGGQSRHAFGKIAPPKRCQDPRKVKRLL